MGQDENRIEIIIDAAETKSAAKSATEANQRLSEFRKALDAFKNGIGDLNKTIETNTTTVANFNTFLKDFSVKLNDNLSKMQESVIKDFEPRLEKNLENMVARAINKVEAKTSAPGKESRSRSEPKAGAGAPVNNIATVAQPKGYESPDAIMRETIDSVRKRIIDPLTGAVQEATTQKTKTTTTRVERFQEEREDGEIVNVERKINDVVHSVSKIGSITDALNKTKFTDNPVEQYLEDINKKWKSTDPDLPDFAGSISDAIEKSTASHTWASPMDQFSKTMQKPIENIYGSGTGYGKPVKEKGEKKSNNWADPSNMLRREITGALIALHVMKVVAGNSQVAASGFAMVSNAIGHLLNIVLVPMIPVFQVFAQLIHQVANVINSMPYGIRLLIGGLVMWKATSALIASMPIREFGSGIEQLKENLKGGSDTLNKFGEVVKALINFMNSGLRGGRVQGLAEWVGGKIRGKRAGGGPVGASNAYVVGEKGPELFVPDSSGTIVPNSAFRADGGGVEAGGGLPFGDILGNLGAGLGAGGLTYLLTGSPLLAGGVGAGAAMLGPAGIAEAMSGIISSEIGQQVIGSLNVLTGTISSLFAPLAPIFGILSVALGVVTGLKGGGGGGDKGAETTAKVGNAINSTVSRGNFGIQSVINTGNMGTNKMLSMILVRLAGCLRVAPCDGANFGGAETTVIAGLLPTILASIIAIPQGINTKLGEFITEATVKIKSIWEPIPQPEALQDRVAKIRYQIETVGVVPIAENVSARIQYTIETTGKIPEVTNRVATLEYVETVRPLTEEQMRAAIERVSNIAERYPIELGTSLKEITPADVALLTERIETLAKVDPVEITVKILADGTPEFTFKEVPRVISIADIRTADVSKLSPVRAPTTLYVPEGTVPLLPAGISAKLPVVYDTSRSVLPSIKDPIKLPMNPEISGFVGDGKGGYKASGRFNGGFVDMSGAKIPGWEYLGNGMYRKIGAFEGPIEFKVAEGTDPLKGIDWKGIGKSAGGFVGIGILTGLVEYNATGSINIGNWLTGLVVGSIAFIGAESILTGIATSLGGAAAGGVVAGAFATLGTVIAALIAVPLAVALAADLGQAIQTALSTGDWSKLDFKSPILKLAQDLGDSLGTVIYEAGQKFANFINGHGFRTNQEIQDLLKAGQTMAQIDADPSMNLATLNITVDKDGNFIRNFQSTIDKGIPVDVKFDVTSLTKTIESTMPGNAGVGGGTRPPTGTEIPGNPDDPTNPGGTKGPDLGNPDDPTNPGGTKGPDLGNPDDHTVPTCGPGMVLDSQANQCVPAMPSPMQDKEKECQRKGLGFDPQAQNPDGSFGACVGMAMALGGTLVPNVPTLVGEKGPELIIPKGSGTVVPNDKLGGGGGSNVTNNFTFNVTTNNPKELTDTVMRELKMELARVKM